MAFRNEIMRYEAWTCHNKSEAQYYQKYAQYFKAHLNACKLFVSFLSYFSDAPDKAI